MSDSKIQVPEGMLEAVDRACPSLDYLPAGRKRDILEAALRWLSKNPIVPTKQQALELCQVYRDAGPQGPSFLYDMLSVVSAEWQRRMFLAPDPDEPIRDLLVEKEKPVAGREGWWTGKVFSSDEVNEKIREAHRRGREGK
jgi:hypothetical protein